MCSESWETRTAARYLHASHNPIDLDGEYPHIFLTKKGSCNPLFKSMKRKVPNSFG